MKTERNEFAYTLISLDKDDYDEEVTITVDVIPTLEHKARGKESEYSEVREDDI